MLLPVAIYGLEVPAGGMPVAAIPDFPATFRITMAAIDPNAEPKEDGAPKGVPARATLKLIREPIRSDEDEDESDDEDDYDSIRRRLGDAVSDEESSDEDEDEKNGGPSDPSKTKKGRAEAALKKIMESLGNEDDDMEVDDAPKKNKGKGKASAEEEDDDDEEDEDSDDEDGMEVEEFVICTLDPKNTYQQPLDITIGEDEHVFFQVTGAYDISLTGNYVVPDHTHDDDDEDDEDYDLSPDEDELEDEYETEEEDELDGLEDPRITEVDSEEEAPKLVEAPKGKNKRGAESLDEMISKEAAGEKLSKKQQKKLKNNEGKAIEAAKESPADKKKVQFAKNLEQGPTGSPLPKKDEKAEKKPEGKDQKTGLGLKVVQGVKVDDKKLGSGPAAKKGDRVGMRYIGKLENGKVFDSNKKGKPFSFKLGSGEVIKGWDIGIAGMTVGGERRITIPANLAYGKQSLPGIPANSTLVFDIKMVSLN
ncbi:uncharacterized protein K452DRAFT_218111 [Aplosporella prunicola CBS 121167]|uniref:FK506-binding protein n=1 Tax=Aplosporella prunicola CBS 121167 TaxID=1176127 RepID=A0A6A6BTK2_9PEZI|nr:uncharacterized protein K452DRAFT_218111 [Aplosporella prunicola CBS 121167]KAF2147459.1 hypothetical protein K452DRAFT_218111 [Aplosporella prunicola CBS 121167]